MRPRYGSRTLVGAALVVVAAGAGYMTFRTPSQVREMPVPAGERDAAPSTGEAAVADIRLEALEGRGEAFERSGRDLFRFRTASAPPSPAAPPPSAVQNDKRLGPPEPPVPTGPPPPPPIALKFIGVLEGAAQTGRVAVLSDSRGNVFHGKEGDIIDGRYRVLKIGVESAELAYVDGRGRQMLRLSGQ